MSIEVLFYPDVYWTADNVRDSCANDTIYPLCRGWGLFRMSTNSSLTVDYTMTYSRTVLYVGHIVERVHHVKFRMSHEYVNRMF